jgi:hypothetical protein
MSKLLLIAVVSLVSLGTAVSEPVRVEAAAGATTLSPAGNDVSTRATEQVVSLWSVQSKSNASGHLARPL